MYEEHMGLENCIQKRRHSQSHQQPDLSLKLCFTMYNDFCNQKQSVHRSCCTLGPQFWYVPELFREVYNSGDSGVPGLFLLAILVCTRIVTQAILVRTRIVREFLTCLPIV